MTPSPATNPAQRNQLSADESSRLAVLEPIIERGLGNFLEVGNALLEISDRRLYRETHSSFKDYVEEKWKMTAQRAYQLCEAAEVIKALPEKVSTMVDNERQARALAKVPAPRRAKVLKAAASNGEVTAKSIAEAAQSTPEPSPAPLPNPPAPVTKDAELVAALGGVNPHRYFADRAVELRTEACALASEEQLSELVRELEVAVRMVRKALLGKRSEAV